MSRVFILPPVVFFKSKTRNISSLEVQLKELDELRREITVKADETAEAEKESIEEESETGVSDSEAGCDSSDEEPGFFCAANTAGVGSAFPIRTHCDNMYAISHTKGRYFSTIRQM